MHRFVKIIFPLFMFMLVISSTIVSQVLAHEIRPSIVDVTIHKDGTLELQIKINLEAVITEIDTGVADTDDAKNAAKYDAARKLKPNALITQFGEIQSNVLEAISIEADGSVLPLTLTNLSVPPVGDVEIERTSLLSLSVKLPSGAKSFTWSWAKKFGGSVLRVKTAGGEKSSDMVFAGIVKGGELSKPIPLDGLIVVNEFEVFSQYISLGFEHIIPKGTDHILFVVGLFLLSSKLSSLLWQISAFTLAHTITLGLAMAGVISAPASFIEPLIALSIVFVAIENVMTDKLSQWRPLVVFLFGLLHGLGFASVLNEIGFQPTNFFMSLLGFNIGVEFGQLAVILICYLMVGLWFSNKPYYRRYITTPASIAIAAMGAYWFVERAFF